MNIQLVVFDMAGTTVHDADNVGGALVKAIQEKTNLNATINDVNQFMGIPKPLAIKKVLENKQFSNISKKLVDEIHNRFLGLIVEHYKVSPDVREKDGFTEISKWLKDRGVKIAIDTGFNRLTTQTIIDRLEWEKDEKIDFSIAGDEVENGRPFPDMIQKAMNHFQITKSQKVAKVGDAGADMEEGQNAGCKYVIGVTTGSHTREELAKFKPTHLIEELLELKNIID